MLKTADMLSPDTVTELSESDVTSVHFKDTELTLGLPGGGSRSSPAVTGGTKRGFIETVDLNLGSSPDEPRGGDSYVNDTAKSQGSHVAAKPPAAKAQVVGWPPVRSYRKKVIESCSKYVKVAVDGTPYLRKVDLQTYSSYQGLLRALQELFTCFTIHRNYMDESKLMDPIKGTEYVPTYEDKDGDWMLVGDVPWKMFIESCKRIRLMKSSEAVGLAPRTSSKCSSTS